MFVDFLANKNEDLTCLCSILSRIQRKTGSSTTTKSFEENNVSYSFLRTKIQMSTPFLRDRAWLFAHVFYIYIHPEAWPPFFFYFFAKQYWFETTVFEKTNLDLVFHPDLLPRVFESTFLAESTKPTILLKKLFELSFRAFRQTYPLPQAHITRF